MKRSTAPFAIAFLLLLLAAPAVFAADAPFPAFLAAPAATPALAAVLAPPAVASAPQAVPADTDPCGLRMYSCQSCGAGTPEQKLCYTQICGNFVIVHCDPCKIGCVLPPS